MTNEPPAATLDDLIANALHRVLNSHGHAYQSAVLESLEGLFNVGADWAFEVAEFPVLGGGEAVHIDFILRHRSRRFCIVAECKRANPKLNHWCFVRSQYVRRDYRTGEFIFDQVHVNPNYSPDPFVVADRRYATGDVAHVFHVLKLREDPTPTDSWEPPGRNSISEALAQVCRGVSGLVDRLCDRTKPLLVSEAEPVTIVPVIFTTANLWIVADPLKGAGIEDGNLATAPTVSSKGWVALEYPVSPALRPSAHKKLDARDLSEALQQEHLRTVFVVSSPGMKNFLNFASNYFA